MTPKLCLATVTCDRFATGTEVLLYSFLKHNPWFEDDIIIFIDSLSPANRARLTALYPVKFVSRAQDVENAIALLREQLPELRADLHLRLLSLEILRLTEYQRVVFLDSDGLVTGDLTPLFQHKAAFVACRDGFSYEDCADLLLKKAGYPAISQQARYGQATLPNSFNSGMMSIGAEILTAQHYQQIVSLLGDFSLWRAFGLRGFTDQMLLNVHFQGQVEIIDGRYNFMPFIEQYVHWVDGITLTDACFIHYAGLIKPWFNYDEQEILTLAPHYLKYLQLWHSTWQAMHFANDTQFAAQQILAQYHWTETYGATMPNFKAPLISSADKVEQVKKGA
ncbi:glycosyltransferase family 8 protein [Pseudoalteromonas fenneropenaei]|uniref:Glycosyltransferase family 8 protein n=1 Tax=Pseudoalteromonas fenneropenaei TaxID=1737459 RepID=A0ABV7CI24_9GAMM